MITCNNCGMQNADNAVVCSACGQPVQQAYQSYTDPAAQAQYTNPQQQQTYQNYANPTGQAQYTNPQQPYYPPNYGAATQGNEAPISIGTWLGYMILMCIPIVNIVVLILTLTSNNKPKSLKNWLLAQLILTAIIFVIYIMILVLFGTAIASLSNYY